MPPLFEQEDRAGRGHPGDDRDLDRHIALDLDERDVGLGVRADEAGGSALAAEEPDLDLVEPGDDVGVRLKDGALGATVRRVDPSPADV